MLYIENPKDATRKLLEIINEFDKFARYKINTQSCFLCITTHILNTTRLLESDPGYQITSSLYTSGYIIQD